MKERLASDYERRLSAERQSFESGMHNRLTEELLTLSGYGGEDRRAHQRLLHFAEAAQESEAIDDPEARESGESGESGESQLTAT